MSNRDEIARQALALPPDERAYVADVIEQSLSSGDFATTEIAEAWAAEIERRIQAYDRGETHALDGQTSVERIRKMLADRRAGKATP
jgi:putative addiction module component (TIGR02574 family)